VPAPTRKLAPTHGVGEGVLAETTVSALPASCESSAQLNYLALLSTVGRRRRDEENRDEDSGDEHIGARRRL
jgi:hypothetical protein